MMGSPIFYYKFYDTLVSKITQVKRKLLFQKLLKNPYLILSYLVFAMLGLYLPSYAQVKNFVLLHGGFAEGSGFTSSQEDVDIVIHVPDKQDGREMLIV